MELTKHRSTLLLLLVSLFAASQSASFYGNSKSESEFGLVDISDSEQTQSCSQSCAQLYSQVQYETGKTYIYDVDLTTRIGQQQSDEDEDDESNDEQTVKISAHADISVYSSCELVLKLRKVHLSGVQGHSRMAQQLEAQPLHFAYEDGKIVDLCASPADDKWIVDVKKSIVSALQMSSSDITKKQTVIETDISGQCETVYQPIEQTGSRTVIRKIKQMNKCGARHQFNTAFFPRSYGLDQALRSSLPFISSNATNECTLVIKNQIVEQVTCADKTRVWPLGVKVASHLSVKLIEKKPTLSVQPLTEGFRKHRLTMSMPSSMMSFQSKRHSHFGQQEQEYSVNDVQQLLVQIGQHVQTAVQSDVPVLFAELIHALPSLSVAEQSQLWEQVRSHEISPSNKLIDIFLDASALAGNEGSAQVLINAYQQQQISQQRANYLFGLLSFAKQPTVEAAQRLVQFVQQIPQQQLVEIPRGIIFGITGFVHNLQVVQQQANVHSPQIDQLVQTLSTLLVQTLQQQIGQVSNQLAEHQLLTIAYALRNLILAPVSQQQKQQDQPQITQQLIQILQQVPYTQYNQEVRVAIVRTLVTAGINDDIRQYLLEHVIPNTQEGIEIQIEAYRAVVLSGATQHQLEQILAFTEQVAGQPELEDLVNYIRSHQANLRTTSDPQKQTILPVNAPVFPRPSGQFFGISRNYEISYVNQELNVGVTAETDIIFNQQQTNQFAPVPQTVSFNLTIPIGGAELQLVEVRLHQHGLEPVIARHLAKIQRSGEKDPWKVAKETVEYIIEHGADILAENPQVHLLIQISVDGKTVLLIDEQDVISGELKEQTFVQELMSSLHQQVTIDRAFAITPIDTQISFPSVNGLPVQVRVNSSVVLGLRTDLTFDVRDFSNSVVQFGVWPSVASQLETAVEFTTGPEQRSIELVQNFYSAPQLNLVASVKNGHKISVKVDLPEDQYILARYESQLYTRNQQGQRVRVNRNIRQQQREDVDTEFVHVCTNSTQDVLGVVLCYDFTYSTPNQNSIDVVSQISLVKTDPQMKSYELYLETPYSIEKMLAARGRSFQSLRNMEQPFGQLQPFKFVFNTPGSEIDREIVLEVELPNSGSDLVKDARLRIQTPWKKVLAQASVRAEPKERSAAVEIAVDGEKFLQMELALETIRRGQKTEYRPRLTLAMQSVLEKPVQLEGVLMASAGRKSSIHFQLEDTQAKRQYIKGTYIRERGDRQSFLNARTSADVKISLLGLNAKMATSLEATDRLVNLDASAEYQLPSWERKEQARIGFKVQNLSQGKTVKLLNFGVVKISQFPKYQVRLSQNLLYTPSEQFEQDFKLGWAADDDEQIRLYQSLKTTTQRGKLDVESQAIVVYRPADINYEVRGTAGFSGFGVPTVQKRYQLQLSGQSRDQQWTEANFKAEYFWEQLSKSPLKMTMKATLKNAQVDFIYSDEIEEQSPAKYHGHVLIQITPEEKFSADYVYQIKRQVQSEADFEEHELELEVKNSRSQRIYRKHGLLRMEPAARSILIRSKLSSDESGDIFDGELKKVAGKTNFVFTHYPKDIRAKMQLDNAGNGQWELSTPTMKHESQFEYVPRRSWQFASKTKRNAKNWLEIDAKSDRVARSHRFALNSAPFEGEYLMELPEGRDQKAQIRVQMPASWSHLTSISRKAAKPYITLDSRTKFGDSNIADLAAKYDAEDEHYFRLNTPFARTDLNAELAAGSKQLKKVGLSLEAGAYSHQSKLSIDNQDNDDDTEYDFESTTRKSDKPIVNLRYKLADNVHNFVIDSPQFLEAQAKANLARSFLKPYASIDAKWTDKWTGQPVHHKSKLTGERDSQSDSLFDIDAFQFESQTLKNQNQNLAQIEASLSKRRNQKSFAQIRIGDRLSSKIELEPYKSASLKIDAPEYDHLTELTYQPSEQDGKWRIQSQTIALKKQNQKYLIDAEHQRNQRSAFKIDVPQFESQLAYEHPLSDLANHQMLFAFNGKSMESPLEHKTQMRWLNQGKQNPQIRLDSQTFRKSPFSGEQENVLSIEGAYNHNDSQMPSSLKLKYGKTLSGDLDMSLFDPSVKVLNLSGQLKDDRFFGGHQYTHQTQARFQPLISRLSVESNTDKNGQSVAQLKTLLSGDLNDKSYINLKAGIRSPMKALMELEPRGRRALVDFDFAPYQHRTEFSKQMQGPFQLKTVTSRDEKNLLDIDGQLFPTLSEQSYLKVKANSPYNQDNLYEGEFSLHPEKRFGQLSLRTNSLNHDSMFKLDDDIEQSKTALFKTNTVYRDQVLAKIDARLRGLRGENSIDAQLPQMTLKTLIDVPTKKGSFDVQHHRYRRHLLGSVAINQQQQQFDSDKSFHFDLAWDVDRNPASKVQIDLTARKIPSQRSSAFLRKSEELVVIASAQYGASKIVFNSEIVPQQVMQNPVRVSLAYVPLDQSRLSESWQLIYSHTMQSESQYQCKWDFLVGEQIKYGLQINSQLTGERFQFGAQTQAPQKPHLQVTFNMAAGVRKPGEQYYMEATAVQAETNRYQVTFDLTKHLETRKLDGTLELRFPNFEVHVVAFSIDLVQKQFKLDVTNEKTGKQVDVEASYSDNLVHLNAVSNIPFFPAVDAKIRYVPGEIVHAKLDLDQQRKFELTVKYTGELSTLQFYALTKVDSVYTPSVELIAEGSKNPDEEGSHQRSVIVTGKYNMVPVLSANLQQQDVQQWTAEGQISSLTGEKIVEASVQAIPVQTAVQQQPQQQYLVRVSPRSNSYVQPFVATIDEQQPTAANGHVRAIKIELTQPVAQQLIASAQIALKHRQWIEVPQMIEVTLQHVPSNSHGSFRVSIREQIDSHYLQQQKQQIITEPSLFDTTEQTTGVSSKRISRQIRDQAVVSWNQKAAGFSLLTTQYATSGNDAEEHDFKLYSPSRAGRVLQVRCAHQFSSTLLFFKQQFKTDLDRQREPIYQYTVMAQIAPNSGYTGRVQLESFKFVRSPKTVEFTIEPATPTTPVDVKLRIDAGASEDQAVTVRTVVQRTQSQNQVSIFGQISQNHTLHFSAKTQDRTVLDFEIDGHVSDSSVGLVWQNLNRKGQRQQGQYLVRFIGQDRFEAVIATPAQRYLVQGVYKRKTNAQTSPLVMDFVVSKLVSKQNTWGSRAPEPVLVQEHKVHIESVDKCIRAEIEDISQQSGVQQQESTRQVNICLDFTRSSLVQVEVDSIKNGRKTAEFNARLDARSVAQALQLSLKWEPKYTRQIVATLLQLSQQSQQTLTEQLAKQEWAQEIAHKLTVGQQLVQDFALEPIYKIVIDELMPILEEFGITQQIIQKWAQIVLEPVEQVYEAIEQYLEQNYQNVEQFYEEVIQSAQKTCYQSRTCSRLATLISQVQSSEDLARLVAEPLVQLLQKTHRIVVHSQGKLIRQLPEFNFVEQFVPEAVQQFIGQTVETIYEYVRDALVNPQTGVTPFAGIVSHLEVIVQELLQSAEWRSVNWERIQQALEQAVQLLVSPRAWSSSVRVLLWDPQNGQLQVQIKSPAGFSVRNILSDNQTNSSPSNSSWFGPSQKSYIINRQPGSNISQQQQQPSQSFQGPISFLFNQGQQEQIPQQQQQKPTTSYWSQWRQQQQQQAGINNRNTGRYY